VSVRCTYKMHTNSPNFILRDMYSHTVTQEIEHSFNSQRPLVMVHLLTGGISQLALPGFFFTESFKRVDLHP